MTCALFRLAFAAASNLVVFNFATYYNSTAHFPRGTRSLPKKLPLLVSTRFQVCFTPRQGCFSPFPLGTMRYRSLTVFSLGPWAARIQTEFLVLRSTWDWVSRGIGFSSTRLSRSAARFSNTIRLTRSFLTLRKLSSASSTVPQLPPQQRLLPCTARV